MKTIITVLFVIVFITGVSATAQFPDKIIYNGTEYSLHNNPLETYFEKNPEKKPIGLSSTALWRGYIATFEVKDKELFLKDIQIMVSDTTSGKAPYKWKSVINEVFPNKQLKIDWLTGLLVLPYGEIVNYVHMGYGSTYKKYILLEFENGNLKNDKQFKYKEYEKFKERQFQAFKETEEYKKLKEQLKKDGSSDGFIDSFLRSFITNYTTKILPDK